VNFSPDSDQQCSAKRTGEMAGSSHKELSFRTAKQRTHSVNKKQTSNILEVDKSHEMANICSGSHQDHHLLESNNTSGEISEPCFFSVCVHACVWLEKGNVD
jgi:hypothetical protein